MKVYVDTNYGLVAFFYTNNIVWTFDEYVFDFIFYGNGYFVTCVTFGVVLQRQFKFENVGIKKIKIKRIWSKVNITVWWWEWPKICSRDSKDFPHICQQPTNPYYFNFKFNPQNNVLILNSNLYANIKYPVTKLVSNYV